MVDSTQTYHFFSNDEAKNMNKEFMATLDRARGISGVPYIGDSWYRTPEHNFSVGGVSDSAHSNVDQNGNPDGLAVDLAITTSQQMFLTVKGLLAVGLCRLGFYYRKNTDGTTSWTHLHVDGDTSKPQEVCWIKEEGT